MTFLELCQRVFDEGDRAPYAIESTDWREGEDEQIYKVINWVKQAYKEIQQWNKNFDFFHQSGILLTTDVGVSDYVSTGIRDIIFDSLYCRRLGDINGWPLSYLSYKQWRDQYQNVNLSDSTPVVFTQLPNKQFRLSPAPEDVYTISADWFTTYDSFEDDDDEPIWDADDHEIIVWVALQYYMSEYETPEELGVKARLGLRHAKKQFLFRYLPSYEVTGSFA